MKKIALALLLILLVGCQKQERTDYYVLGLDDYTITVGYDNSEYLKVIFDYDIKETLEGYEEVKDVDLTILDQHIGYADFANPKRKEKESSKAILNKLSLYLKDTGSHFFSINGLQLSTSIQDNCSRLNGKLVERNGYACVIEQEVHEKDNAIILYGDISNLDQDELDRIEILVK